MEYLTQIFDQLSYHSFGVMGLLVLGFALLNCFLGYRLRKFWMALLGFLIGAFAGFAIASVFTNTGWILLAATLGSGIVLAFLAFRLYLFGVFLYTVFVGYGFVVGLIGHDRWWSLMLCVAAALVIGILAVKFVRPVIILTTAVSGGFTAVNQILGWLSVTDIRFLYGLALALSLVGILVQFRGKR